MVNDHQFEGGRDEFRRGGDAFDPHNGERPLADREVPLGSGHPAVAVHQWLDGEGSESSARLSDAREVELWNRINEEAERRRRMRTPAPVLDRIMASIPNLPAVAPAAPKPWWQGSVSLSPIVLAGAGLGMLVLGALVGSMMR
jgi:hypothetical protein